MGPMEYQQLLVGGVKNGAVKKMLSKDARVREHQRPKIAGRFEFKKRHSQKDGIFTCDTAPHITSKQSSASSGIRYRPRRVPSLST